MPRASKKEKFYLLAARRSGFRKDKILIRVNRSYEGGTDKIKLDDLIAFVREKAIPRWTVDLEPCTVAAVRVRRPRSNVIKPGKRKSRKALKWLLNADVQRLPFLKCSARVENVLNFYSIQHVHQLASTSRETITTSWHHTGKVCIAEIERVLKMYGLRLGMKINPSLINTPVR